MQPLGSRKAVATAHGISPPWSQVEDGSCGTGCGTDGSTVPGQQPGETVASGPAVGSWAGPAFGKP